MNSTSISLQIFLERCSWFLLASAGLLGLVALASPKTFRSLAQFGGQWLDSSKLFAHLDKRIDVDRVVLPYSRALGAAVIATVAILCLRFTAQ